MMKRASVDFHKSHGVDEEATSRLKHQALLQELLKLQKEFVSKKRKLQTAKQKRDTLLTEVRFLRRRQRYLVKYQSPKHDMEKYFVHQQNADIQIGKLEGERNHNSAQEILVKNSNKGPKEGEGEGEEPVSRNAWRVGRKPQSYLFDDKRVGKKKILWQDPVTLKV
ncbi:unnamed protein product [Ilex paraguariensis]|uniref:rRNA-processing protein efg1 n=1 Tax=Ilex paraguariensis TaxID=185542 RepID=A0ABC8RY88_9AQUA